MHFPADTDGKPTYHCRSVHKKQVCRICGWERKYSMPVDSGAGWIYGDWVPPDRFEKATRPDGDQ